MKKKEIVMVIISVLEEVMEILCDSDDRGNINEKTRAADGLKNFDSLAEIAATVNCLEKFNIEYDKPSLFTGENSSGRSYGRTVGEVADMIIAINAKNKKGNPNE